MAPYKYILGRAGHYHIRELVYHLGPADYEVGPWKMAFFRGPTFVVGFLKNSIHIAFGLLTRCKPNVDQEG
jgi:hypothetical protein